MISTPDGLSPPVNPTPESKTSSPAFSARIFFFGEGE
jgi:hypothetical protein